MTTTFGACADLPVVFEDECLIAIDKPVGLLSQPGKRVHDSVSVRVRDARPDARGSLLVHRLDMDTSGVLLLAKTPEAHAALQQQFERRLALKRYRAVLEREPDADAGRIDLPLRLDVDDRPRQIVCHAHGRASRTIWRVAGESVQFGRREIVLLPRTGRTHQLRVHAADAAGLDNPIRGDRLYGQEAERLYLHAERLVVTHPVGGERLVLTAPVPFRSA